MTQRTIIPALLEPSFTELTEKIYRVDEHFSRVQIDIVDGVYAPNQTWPYAVGEPLEVAVRRLHNLTISFDLDLMVHEPEAVLDQWLAAGASRVIIHLSSTKQLITCVDRVRQGGSEVYVGVVIGDHLDALSTVADHIDGVQCMGIATVGKQGEPFDPRVFDLIQSLRDQYPLLPLAVDGGVSSLTIPALVDAGVSTLVVGSALFAGDIDRNVETLTAL